jgi:hypothetical protein
MGHYAAEMGYETPRERGESIRKLQEERVSVNRKLNKEFGKDIMCTCINQGGSVILSIPLIRHTSCGKIFSAESKREQNKILNHLSKNL